MISKYTVDQTVWMVLSCRNVPEARFAKVTKVGRKWVTLDCGHRFNAETGEIDGGRYSSPGRVYESREAHEAGKALAATWRDLARDLGVRIYRAPAGVTVAHIEQARLLLGLGK